MNRNEFEALRNLPDKRIAGDIRIESKQATSPNLTFEDVVLENSLNYDVVLNGTYKPDIPSVTFNFVLRGVGPICRLCVNGPIHPGAGRTHKHDLRQDSDPRNNLPIAVARTELDGSSAREIWEDLMRQAKIEHTSTFHDPDQAP
jgi:hypothetical protein